MKNIIRIMISLAVAAALTSCKDLLDKQPQSSLTPEEFFSTKAGLEPSAIISIRLSRLPDFIRRHLTSTRPLR